MGSPPLTDRRRWLAFAGVVVALIGIGLYLTLTSSPEPDPPAAAATTAAAPVQTTAAPESRTPPTSGPFDIYPLLPLPKEAFAAAADVAHRFATEYATFRWDEDPAAYAARLTTMTTAELGGVLARGASSPATLAENRQNQVVSTGSARLESIRDMSKESVVFVVVATQRLTSAKGGEERAERYAVTVSRIGETWKVHDIQPAAAGQEGDVP